LPASASFTITGTCVAFDPIHEGRDFMAAKSRYAIDQLNAAKLLVLRKVSCFLSSLL